MSAWVLPDHIADVLPSEARHIEELRRSLLDTARGYGYELIMPPLLEHLDSLLTGTGEALDLQTFKLVDQMSGRMLGLRADTTQQAARIDAHLLNRRGVTRLCYCGPVLRTWPDRPHVSREPLQFGAETYGHAGREADLETLELALACLNAAQVRAAYVDMADIRIVRSLLDPVQLDAGRRNAVYAALAAKDASELAALSHAFPAASRAGLLALPQLYGDGAVLAEARRVLPETPAIAAALDDLQWLASRISGARVGFDLADLRGYAYYSGVHFAIYAQGASDVVAKGGRYDAVGAAFGRKRPAVGFGMDLKQLVGIVPARGLRGAIRAPWADAAQLRSAIAALRAAGETVICVLPGEQSEVQEFRCDRELVDVGGEWVARAL
ncbi:MAG: ATP phosphoribosyltransferase regulatory subunit [Giesbergeria sp.]